MRYINLHLHYITLHYITLHYIGPHLCLAVLHAWTLEYQHMMLVSK